MFLDLIIITIVFISIIEYLNDYVWDVIYKQYIEPYKQLDARTLEKEQEQEQDDDNDVLSNIEMVDEVFTEDSDDEERQHCDGQHDGECQCKPSEEK